jgi:hypothetical protein
MFALIVACVILSLNNNGKEGIGMLEQRQDTVEEEASRSVSDTPPPCRFSYIMEDIYGHCRISAASHMHMQCCVSSKGSSYYSCTVMW